jgi:hypothetical protein
MTFDTLAFIGHSHCSRRIMSTLGQVSSSAIAAADMHTIRTKRLPTRQKQIMDNKHKRSYKQHSEKIAADDFARAPTTVDKKWTAFSSLAGITESNSPVDPNNPVLAEVVVVDEDEENRRCSRDTLLLVVVDATYRIENSYDLQY